MRRLLTLAIISLLLINSGSLFARTENYSMARADTGQAFKDSVVKSIRGFFDELLDVEIGWAALQTRHISNVGYGLDNAIGLNGELRDTMEVLRQVFESEIFIKSILQYDHFWSNMLNRKNYSPNPREIENQFGEPYASEIKFDVRVIPAWDTVAMDVDAARKAKQIAYKVVVKVHGQGEIWMKINQQQLEQIFKENLENQSYTKISKDAKPAVNSALFAGLESISSKIDAVNNFDPNSILNITSIDKFVEPGKEDGQLKLRAYINQHPGYNVSFAKMEILVSDPSNPQQQQLVYETPSVISLSDTLFDMEWDGIANRGTYSGQAIEATESGFIVKVSVCDNENFTGDHIHSKQKEAWVKPDDALLNALFGFLYNDSLYTHDETIRLSKEENSVALKAVNKFGELLEKEVRWANSDYSTNQITVDATSLPLAGTEITAFLDDTEVSVKITKDEDVEVEPIQGDQKLGPIDAKFDSEPVKDKDLSSRDTCVYKVDKSSFTLKLADKILGETAFNIKDASIQYKTLCKSEAILEATVSWNNSAGVDAGTIGFFKSKVKAMELTVDKDGNLAGSVTLNTTLEEDLKVSDYVKIKKGLNSNYDFSFTKDAEGFGGEFDFTKIAGINVDILRGGSKKQPIAKITGGTIIKKENKDAETDYVFAGTAKLGDKPTFETSGFTAELTKLSLTGELALKSKDFTFKKGNADIKLKNIEGVKGPIKISMTYKNHQLSAVADLSKSEVEVYGLKLKGKFDVLLNDKWEFNQLSGSNVKASHKDLTADLTIGSFMIKQGKLENFKITSNLVYKGFDFRLSECSYTTKGLYPFTMSAQLKLGDNKVDVKKLQMDTLGQFTCDKISTSVKHTFFKFNAGVSLQKEYISGNFDGWFLSKQYALKGAIQFGSALDKDFLSYDYGYFMLGTKLTIPLVPGVVSISELGGQFGYNCGINFSNYKIEPEKGRYVAGLSFGLSAGSGALELVVDPARIQFGNNEFDFDMKAELNIPKKKPVFKGTAKLVMQYPENIISGNIGATIKVPPKDGFVINASNNKIYFESKAEGDTLKFASNKDFKKSLAFSNVDLTGAIDVNNIKGDLNATILKTLKLKGNIYYLNIGEKYSGQLSGIAYIDINKKYKFNKFEWLGITADLDFILKARSIIETSFSDAGLGSADFIAYLGMNATGTVKYNEESFSLEGSLEAYGALKLTQDYKKVEAGVELELKAYRNSTLHKSYSFERTVEHEWN
jgi:hypothetical protein